MQPPHLFKNTCWIKLAHQQELVHPSLELAALLIRGRVAMMQFVFCLVSLKALCNRRIVEIVSISILIRASDINQILCHVWIQRRGEPLHVPLHHVACPRDAAYHPQSADRRIQSRERFCSFLIFLKHPASWLDFQYCHLLIFVLLWGMMNM